MQPKKEGWSMKTYTINELAEKLNLNSQTLRKWEKDFKLKIPRNDMGHRYYTDRELELFENIKEWKEKGATLKIINNYLGKSNDFKEQNEQALELVTLDKLTGKEIQELLTYKLADILHEREQKLKDEFKKELQGELEKQEERIKEKVIEQIQAENQKLIQYIESRREEKKGFWSFFKKQTR